MLVFIVLGMLRSIPFRTRGEEISEAMVRP